MSKKLNDNKILIAPSLLSSDMANFSREMAMLEEHIDYVHCDVMDGHFVPNLTFGAPVVKWLKKASKRPLDVHLMIEKPEKWIKDYAEAGLQSPDYLTFHIEACSTPIETTEMIRKYGIKPGVAIKPNTFLSEAAEILSLVDQILIMTVEPGFGGQKFREDVVDKIVELSKSLLPHQIIGVDGGINKDTASVVSKAGARLLVAGAAIYGKPDPNAAADEIRNAAIKGLGV